MFRVFVVRARCRVVVLQRADAEALLAQRADRADGGGGAGERGDARHLVHHRGAADRAIVEERLAAERRVDDEIDLAVDDLVGDVRPAFVHLEDDVDVEAVGAQVGGGPARRDQAEAELGEIARDRQQVRLVVVVDADERRAALGQPLPDRQLRLRERDAEVASTRPSPRRSTSSRARESCRRRGTARTGTPGS